jgi:hypothetical protein
MMIWHRRVARRSRSVVSVCGSVRGASVAEHDSSGDYGYDMLDEVRAALDTPARRPSRRPFVGSHGIGREIDPDGDFGYDHAHEF